MNKEFEELKIEIIENGNNYVVIRDGEVLKCFSDTFLIAETDGESFLEVYDKFNYSHTTNKHFKKLIENFTVFEFEKIKKLVKNLNLAEGSTSIFYF